MSVLVWSVFRDGEHAKAGVEALIESSFPPDEVRLVMKRRGDLEDVPMKRKTAVPAGAAVGATLGAAGAAGAVLLSGGGALLAAGPLAALLQASGMGAALGGIAGALGGLGWWKDEPDLPPDADEPDARVLVLIPVPEGREGEARAALREAGAEQVDALGPEAAAQAHVSDALAEEANQQRDSRREGNA
jgi:hypothetical protein